MDYQARVNEEHLRMLERGMEEMAEHVAREQLEKQKSEATDMLIKVMSAAFDKMSAYISLIVIGGYVAFFSVWSAVEKFVAPTIRLSTFGLMGASVLLFVLAETFRITKFTAEMRSMLRVLRNTPAAHFKDRHAELIAAQERQSLQKSNPQQFVHWATLGAAVVAALILLYGIGDALWRQASLQ